MARYYYGLGGGGSPVAQQLNILGANLRAGLGDIAQDRLAQARLGLAEAQAQHELGKFERYERPQLEEQRAQLIRRQEQRKQPFNVEFLFSGRRADPSEVMHIAGVMDEFSKVTGYKPQLTDQGTISHFQKGDKTLTIGDVEDNPEFLQMFMGAWTDPKRAIETQRERLTKLKSVVHPDAVKDIDAQLQALKTAEKNQLPLYQAQRDKLSKLRDIMSARKVDTTNIDREINRVDKRIDTLGEREFEKAERIAKDKAAMDRLKEKYRLRRQLEKTKATLGGGEKGTAKDTWKREKDLMEIENTIIDGMNRAGEQTPELVAPAIRVWNSQPNAPYHYQYVPGEGGWFGEDSQIIKVPVPQAAPTTPTAPTPTPTTAPTTPGEWSQTDADAYGRYVDLRNQGLSKEDAYAQAIGTAAPAPSAQQPVKSPQARPQKAGLTGSWWGWERGGPEAHYEKIAAKDVAKKARKLLGNIDIQTPSGKWIKVGDVSEDFFGELAEGTRLTPGFLKYLFWDNPKKFIKDFLSTAPSSPVLPHGVPAT